MSTLLEHSEELFKQALETMRKKNADYGGSDQVTGLENFELSARVAKTTVEQGILTRLMDKMARIGNVLDNGPAVETETTRDTIEDAINYLAILSFALKHMHKE